MEKWKVVVNINNYKDTLSVYVNAKTEEQAYLKVKTYFILERPEVNFNSIESATII